MEEVYSQTPLRPTQRQLQHQHRPNPTTARKQHRDVIDLTVDSPVKVIADDDSDDDDLLGYSQSTPSVHRPSSHRMNHTQYIQPSPLSLSSFHNRTLQQRPTNGHSNSNSAPSRSVYSSASQVVDSMDAGFGASIAKPKASKGLASYIRPSTGAFAPRGADRGDSPFDKAASQYRNDGWPSWADEHSVAAARSGPIPVIQPLPEMPSRKADDDEEDGGEEFDLGEAQFTAKDFELCSGDPEEQMRELLAGAVGDGEEGEVEGDETVEGFADNIKLMPHQVRGVRWMRERETGRRNGGILADDMGLGKTVQTLARIVDGRHTPSEKKTYKAGTLIICPLAVMEQWAEECRSKTKKGTLKVTTHHGPKRTKDSKELLKYDVVITTFQVLASEYGVHENGPKNVAAILAENSSEDSDDDAVQKRRMKLKKAAAARATPLFDVKWLRVVIDEAQNIKNHKTKAAKAAVELKAKFRWCLTGTPIQNNVEELYSLFKFLRARPLDKWETFRLRVSSEVKAGRTGVAMKRLQVILRAVMLRRTKTATIDGKPILNLPERKVEVVECMFEGDERAFYDALEQRTALTFNKFLANGTAMSNYTSVLSMLLRLRQACDHPSLVTSALAETKEDANPNDDVADELAGMMSGLGVANERKCEICFAVLEDQEADQCLECVTIAGKAQAKKRKGTDLPPSSAKIRMMMQLLLAVQERSEGKEKTIVFSQFTSFLNLLEPFLKDEGIGYVRYDGTLRNDERVKVLDAIKTDDSKTVILISFKAGSTGLNLTCCNNVILMDLWWNPALEDQAFDRAHRLGQTRDVNIWKLTIAQTVEDRILSLQTQKRELADAALSGTGIKNMKLTIGDIMKLFQRSSDDD